MPCDVRNYGCIATHANPHLRDASLVQGLYVLPCRRSEGVVRAAPSTLCKEVLLCVGTCEQRKLRDPEEVGGTRRGIRALSIGIGCQLAGRQGLGIVNPPRDWANSAKRSLCRPSAVDPP
jgi:hypothetical protein